MAANGDTLKKPAKRGKLSNFQHTATSINDDCRLCCCPLKIKYGYFPKIWYISIQNLFKVSKCEGCQNVTLAELCSKIALKIDRSAMLSNRVCHACGRKIHNAFQLYNFIYLNLETEKETAMIEVAGDSGRFKRLLPTTVSSPDQSPQVRKGLKISGESTAVKKSLSFNDCRALQTMTITPLRNRRTKSHLRKLAKLLSHN